MDALEFLRERERMCNSYDGCKGCPCEKVRCALNSLTSDNDYKRIVVMVEEWSAAHPRKTRQSVFLEQWPITQRFVVQQLIEDYSDIRKDLLAYKNTGLTPEEVERSKLEIEAAQRLTSQYMIDTLQMAIHQTEGWGYERIMRLTEAWQQTQKEYTPALNYNDPAADVMQEHMDRVMAQIIGGKQELRPFPERYHELRKVTYSRR